MALLRKAVEGGHRDAHFIASDPDFELIRSRDDFRMMMMDLAFPIEPFARGD
jgi:hypothetical protein